MRGKPGAAGDEVVDRVGFSADPGAADAVGQQVAGFVRGQKVQRQRMGGLGGDQAGQPIAAGDQDEAAGGAGQERPDLVGVPGVVQHEKHGLVGQVGAVQVGLCAGVGRDPLRRYLDGVQEPADRLGCCHHGAGRVEATQVEVELSIGEPVPHAVGPVHRQGGLAHPGGARHR